MPPPGNDDLIRLERRKQVASFYLRGMSQWEIARELGCVQGTVSKDLAAIRKEWLASCGRDFDVTMAQELAKVDNIEATAWTAWERSCRDAETLHVETVKGRTRKAKETTTAPDGTVTVRDIEVGLPDLSRQSKTVKGQSGDPRFLERVAWCIDRRCKILGVDAAEKHDHTITVEDRRNRLLDLLRSHRERTATEGSGTPLDRLSGENN